MILNLTDLSNDPLHEQIASQLIERILAGEFAPGDSLEPARTVARRQRVSVSSVRRAYRVLEKRGFIRGVGRARNRPGDRDDCYHVEAITQKQSDLYGGRLGSPLYNDKHAEWQRLEIELDAARRIQSGLLPNTLPDEPRLRVGAYSKPSLEVGGDFYDVIPLDRDRIAFVIADASGKGLPAAMMISQLHGMFRSEINHGNDIPTTLRHVNDHLVAFSEPEKFATAFLGILDRAKGALEFANAGHNHPVVARDDGSTQTLESGGTVLGIIPGAEFATGTVVLREGDVLFLYTDGVTEATNARDEEYGEDRLVEMLRANRDRSVDELIDAVIGDVGAFESGDSLQDDRTCLALKAYDEMTIRLN